MESFIVYNNGDLGGVFPPSAKAWTKLKILTVANGKFVGALPALNFTQMSNCGLFDDVDGGPTNQFDCPFPAGALDNCQAYIGPGLLRPITNYDCKNTCTGSSVNLLQPQCDAWVNFYDALGGLNWAVCAGSRTDPCSCNAGQNQAISCSSDGTAVEQL